MEQKSTQRQVLDRLVGQGQISRETADEIRHAPEWSVTVRELVSYLAGLIMLSGVIRVIAVAFRDASQEAIGSALLVAGVLLALVAWKMPHRGDVWTRLAEVVEVGSILTLAGGTAMFLDLTELTGQSIVVIISVPVVLWGYWRSLTSSFVGSVALSAGVPMFLFGSSAIISTDNTRLMGATALASGAVLWVLGQRKVGTAFIQRAVGCYFLLMGSFVLGAEVRGAGRIVPIVVGAALFALGSMNLQFEALASGAIAVTIGVAMAVGDWLPSEFTRGITTIAVGAVMFVAVGAQMRRHRDGRAHGDAQSTGA